MNGGNISVANAKGLIKVFLKVSPTFSYSRKKTFLLKKCCKNRFYKLLFVVKKLFWSQHNYHLPTINVDTCDAATRPGTDYNLIAVTTACLHRVCKFIAGGIIINKK